MVLTLSKERYAFLGLENWHRHSLTVHAPYTWWMQNTVLYIWQWNTTHRKSLERPLAVLKAPQMIMGWRSKPRKKRKQKITFPPSSDSSLRSVPWVTTGSPRKNLWLIGLTPPKQSGHQSAYRACSYVLLCPHLAHFKSKTDTKMNSSGKGCYAAAHQVHLISYVLSCPGKAKALFKAAKEMATKVHLVPG